jgi:hypothetical protein
MALKCLVTFPTKAKNGGQIVIIPHIYTLPAGSPALFLGGAVLSPPPSPAQFLGGAVNSGGVVPFGGPLLQQLA